MAGRAGLNRHIHDTAPLCHGADTAFEVDGAACTR